MAKALYIALFLLLAVTAKAQTGQEATASKDGGEEEYVLTEQDIQQIYDDITNYTNELNNLGAMISGAKNMSSIAGLEMNLSSISVRWSAYYSLEQKDISLNADLTQMLVSYQQTYQIISDSLARQKNVVNADDDFSAAEKFITEAQGKYEEFLSEATKYSLTSATEKQLTDVKTKEQMFFQQIDKQYQAAQAAAALDPHLATRMAALDDVYVGLKGQSETIQAAAYMPFLLRIKDYVLSLAGIAIIILMLTMIQSKISALKAASKAAKEAKKQMMRANKEIPEI